MLSPDPIVLTKNRLVIFDVISLECGRLKADFVLCPDNVEGYFSIFDSIVRLTLP